MEKHREEIIDIENSFLFELEHKGCFFAILLPSIFESLLPQAGWAFFRLEAGFVGQRSAVGALGDVIQVERVDDLVGLAEIAVRSPVLANLAGAENMLLVGIADIAQYHQDVAIFDLQDILE